MIHIIFILFITILNCTTTHTLTKQVSELEMDKEIIKKDVQYSNLDNTKKQYIIKYLDKSIGTMKQLHDENIELKLKIDSLEQEVNKLEAERWLHLFEKLKWFAFGIILGIISHLLLPYIVLLIRRIIL